MSQFSIPLNPVAQPTNQFVAPTVKQPSNDDANQLAQLSGALARVAPELQNVFNKRFQASVEGDQARANADFMQQRFENTKALKDAVDSGHIAESDNPWYMVQLRQDVAANEATDQVRQMNVDWETSPVRFSDDPKGVEDWANGQLSKVTDGRDAYESEAMAPVVQQGVASLLAHHMDVRRQERSDERIANFQQRVSGLLTGPNPQASSDQLKSLIADARLTMPGAQVNAMVIRSAQESAEATGDEGILSVLGSVPNEGAGGTLADFPEIKKLAQELPLMRLRRSMQIDEVLQQQQKAQAEQRKSSLLANLMQATGNRPEKIQITPDLAAKWNIPFADVIDINEKATRYGDLQDEEGDKAATRLDKANARTAHELQGQVQAGLAIGKLKIADPEVRDTQARLSILDTDSANQFNRFLSDFYDQNSRGDRLYARESDPVVYSNLWDQAKAGTLKASDLIPQAQKLSHEDWTRLFHETIKTDSDTKVSDFPMSKYDDLLKDMIVWPKARSDFGGNQELAGKDAETTGRVTRAQTKFAETVQQYLNDPSFTKLPRPNQTAKIHQALNAAAQEFGGVTDEKRQSFADEQDKKAEQGKAQADAKMSSGVTFSDGVGTTADGKTFGTPTSLSDAVRTQVRSVATALDPNDGTRSLDTLYRDGTTRSFWQKLTFQNPSDLRNRDELVLSAYVHNAGLLNSGSFGPTAAYRLVDDANGPRTVPDTLTDVQTSARINFMQQRKELASIRRRLGETWITDDRRDELVKLTSDLSGSLAGKQSIPQSQINRFNDLSEKFRLYDFLSVTAGVDRDDIDRDYRVLYKYPAASSAEELKSLLPKLAESVPPGELRGVLEAQRSLIDNAHDLLVNRRYVP